MANRNPPVPIPSGQRIAWALPTQYWSGSDNVGATNGSAASDTNGGYAQMTFCAPLANGHSWGSKWFGFELPTIPPGSTITAVYPVLTCSGTPCPSGDYYLQYGQSLGTLAPAGSFRNGTTSFFDGTGVIPANGWSEHEFNLPDIGASGIANAGIGVVVAGSLSVGPCDWVISADFVGLAVYYTPPPRPKIAVWISVGNSRLPK